MAKQHAQLLGINSFHSGTQALIRHWTTNQKIRVVSKADYGINVEMGTWKMSAQPYMRPAVERTRANQNSIARRANSADDLLNLLAVDIRDNAKQYAAVDTGYMRDHIEVEQGGD